MNLFEYEKTSPETLQKCEIEWKMAVLVGNKCNRVKGHQKTYVNHVIKKL